MTTAILTSEYVTYQDGSLLLPLNDSRWLPEAGYTIGLPPSAALEYEDNTVATVVVVVAQTFP